MIGCQPGAFTPAAFCVCLSPAPLHLQSSPDPRKCSPPRWTCLEPLPRRSWTVTACQGSETCGSAPRAVVVACAAHRPSPRSPIPYLHAHTTNPPAARHPQVPPYQLHSAARPELPTTHARIILYSALHLCNFARRSPLRPATPRPR